MKKFYTIFSICVFYLLTTPCLTNAQIITTIAGNGIPGYGGEGVPATATEFDGYFLVADASSNIYTCCVYAIRKLDHTTGLVRTIAGDIAIGGFSGDGGPATAARLGNVNGISADASGNLYFGDFDNNRVRKISTAGIITTVAGSGGTGSYSGDGGPATVATMNGPGGVAVDRSGNIYILDAGRIRKVNTAGIITTIAGTGVSGFSGDGGPATLAKISTFSIAVDKTGNIFISDGGFRVRKIDTSNIISTFAGIGFGYSGDGGPASACTFNGALHVATDTNNNVYVSDANSVVRKIDTNQIIRTIAGNGLPGFTGDGGPATNASIVPGAIATDPSGNIYIIDNPNYRLRRVSGGLPSLNNRNVTHNGKMLQVFPNPSNGRFTVTTNLNSNESINLTIYDVLGNKIKDISTAGNKQTDIILDEPPGVYFITCTAAGASYYARIIIKPE